MDLTEILVVTVLLIIIWNWPRGANPKVSSEQQSFTNEDIFGHIRGRCKYARCECDEYRRKTDSSSTDDRWHWCNYCGHPPTEHENTSSPTAPISTRETNNRSFISRWFCRNEMEVLFGILDIGDRLEFNNTMYSHWSLYVGRQTIPDRGEHEHCLIHRTGGRSSSMILLGISGSSGGGRIEWDYMVLNPNLDKVRINNKMDEQFDPFPVGYIVQRAKEMLESRSNVPSAYNVRTNNCEHFVNDCRYGRRISEQVDQVHDTADTVASVASATQLIMSVGNVHPVFKGIAIAGGVCGTVAKFLTRRRSQRQQ